MRKKVIGLPASQTFLSVLTGGGAPSVTCGYCGREHIAVNNQIYDGDDDTRSYIDRAKANKQMADDWVLVTEYDAVGYYCIDDMIIPEDCPCNSLGFYERFMWNNRELWKQYMAMRKLHLQADIDSIGEL